METKERDEISDFMKSTFFSELHIKDKRAIAFYNDLEVKFYFKDQIIEEAGRDVNYFYLIYKG
jgi:signal-transduction protein with cAMP-binding, CBS, and nucleotidyltransferase domain